MALAGLAADYDLSSDEEGSGEETHPATGTGTSPEVTTSTSKSKSAVEGEDEVEDTYKRTNYGKLTADQFDQFLHPSNAFALSATFITRLP